MSVALESPLAKIARITAKIIAVLIAFVLLIVLASAILNFYDPPVSEQAKALLPAPPNPYPSNENIYLAIAGLEGAGQRPITEMGQERIEDYNHKLDSMLLDLDAALSVNSKWDSTKLQFNGNMALGPPRVTSIWSDVKSHRQDIAALLSSNQQLYERYLSLHRLHGYYETARPSQWASLIFVSQPLRVLFLADVANRIQTGTLEQQREALKDLRQDLKLWHTVLEGSGTLVSKLAAVASLHGDFILAADLIADPNSDVAPFDDELGPTLSPSDLKDYRIGNAFSAEFRNTAALLKSITPANSAIAGTGASLSWWQKTSNAYQMHFFKLNATENMSAAYAAQWRALADSEPSLFLRNREAYRDWLKRNDLHFSPSFLYNPVGKILAALAISDRDAYPLRVWDVAAYQRMVYLAFQLKRQHIATANVASFLLAHPEWSTHPVDGKPFIWNPATGELAVNILSEHAKAQRFSLTMRSKAADPR